MRQISTQEIQHVSGGGLLTSVLTGTVKTGIAAGTALGTGFLALGTGTLQAGVIVFKPVVTGFVKAIKFLI